LQLADGNHVGGGRSHPAHVVQPLDELGLVKTFECAGTLELRDIVDCDDGAVECFNIALLRDQRLFHVGNQAFEVLHLERTVALH
jgi:hypothetical protein